MASVPAWGGTIPLVPIGSFRGFLENRRAGKEIRQWFIVTAVSANVVKTALRTTMGRRFVNALQAQVFARLGFKPSPETIGIELQAYIAFMRFQHQQASAANSASRQRSIEKIMRPGKLTRTPQGDKRSPFPLGYFETLTKPTPRPAATGTPQKEGEEDERNEDESFLTWFERRKRRKGRLVNV